MRSNSLLGQILATVLTGAIDAGVILANPEGVITNPGELANIINGFLSIWAAPAPTPTVAPTPAPTPAPAPPATSLFLSHSGPPTTVSVK